MNCSHTECCSSACVAKDAVPVKNMPFTLSPKALEHWNDINNVNNVNPIMAATDEEATFLHRLNQRFPVLPTAPKPELIYADGTVFGSRQLQPDTMYAVFLGNPGEQKKVIELTLDKSDEYLFEAYHLMQKTFNVPVHLSESIKFQVPVGTQCSERSDNVRFSLTEVTQSLPKVAFWVLPAGTNMLSFDGTCIISNPANKRVRPICNFMKHKFTMAVGSKIAFGKIKAVTEEIVTDLKIDVEFDNLD